MAVNRARRKANCVVAKKVQQLNGRHPTITFDQEALFRNEGVYLSDMENDIWLESIVEGIRGWLQV